MLFEDINLKIILDKSCFQRTTSVIKALLDTLLKINLFKRPYNDEFGRRSEIITTRLYLFLLSVAIFNLILFTSISEYTITVKVPSPTISTYRQLAVQYKSTLSCPCSRLTAGYKTFMTIEPVSYHILKLSRKNLKYLQNVF